MADVELDALPAASTLTGADLLHVKQGGIDKKAALTVLIALLGDLAPSLLNTIDELAAAIGDDPSFAATMTTALAAKAADAAVVHNTGAETIAGVKTFSASPIVPDPTTAQQAASRAFVLANAGGGSTPDADATTKGKLQLAGDLGGTAAAPTVPGLALKAPVASPTFTGFPKVPAQAWLGDGLTQPGIGFTTDPDTGWGQITGVAEDGNIALMSNGRYAMTIEVTPTAAGGVAPQTITFNSRGTNRLAFYSASSLNLHSGTGHLEFESGDSARRYEVNITGYRLGTAQASTIVFATDGAVAQACPVGVRMPAAPTVNAFEIRDSTDTVITQISSAGKFQAPAGTAAAPGFSFVGAAGNGMSYLSGTAATLLSAGGVLGLTITSGYMVTSSTHTNFFIDSALTHRGTQIGFNNVTPVSKSTGWGAPTGTTTKTTFDTASVTTAQLAERVKGLIDYLTLRGDIGA